MLNITPSAFITENIESREKIEYYSVKTFATLIFFKTKEMQFHSYKFYNNYFKTDQIIFKEMNFFKKIIFLFSMILKHHRRLRVFEN